MLAGSLSQSNKFDESSSLQISALQSDSDNVSKLINDVITPLDISEQDLPSADIMDQNDWNFETKVNKRRVLPNYGEEEKTEVFKFKPKKPIHASSIEKPLAPNKPRSRYFKYVTPS